MIIETLKTLYVRDLNKLKIEIESYRNEEKIWETGKNIANSAGNLCLHLIGNLHAFIGVGLAQTGYIRERDLEFSRKNVPQAELVEMIRATIGMLENGFDNLSPERLSEDFPVIIWDDPTETEYALVHLLTHLNWHLGQINYHRRLLDN